MARIEPIDPAAGDPALAGAFAAQTRRWGAPLLPFRYYARRPTIFKAVQGMWAGIAASGLVSPALTALVNRRVAALNRCEF
jgi:hypothetical protein